MRLFFFAACLALTALPAHAQIIVGCGPAAIAATNLNNATKLGSQADCFHRVAVTVTVAEQARRDRIKAIGKVQVPPVPVPTPTPVPPPIATLPPATPPASAVQIGISTVPQVYFGTERIWANLAYRSSEWMDVVGGFNAQGTPVTAGRIFLTAPNAVYTGTSPTITCTWQGAGKVYLYGDNLAVGDHTASVQWRITGTAGHHGGMWLDFSESDGTFANLDCREAGVVTNGRLDQRYVDDMKLYSVIRFLDWVHANDNLPVTWATRSLPGTAQVVNGDQPLEDMIEVANAAGADAWFNIPWNTDDDYVRRMATLIRDTLKGKAYFETGNEVWNFAFGVTNQALNEGISENLSPDKYTNAILRYAEKTVEQNKILTDVFKDQPRRLVRVASFQSGNTYGLDQFMKFRDAAQWVDAIADAPYFGIDALNTDTPNTKTLDELAGLVEASRVATLKNTDTLAAAAKAYGKRSMIYEGGQGTISSDVNADVNVQLQHSPAMGAAYDRYLAGLKATHDGPLMLYNSTGVTSKYGSWGQHDFTGAPSVKRDAILNASGKR